MKEILIRLLVAAFLTFAALALSAPARGQQAAPKTNSASQSVVLQNATPASAGDDQTQEALVFTGQIEPEKGTLVLIDPVARITYQLDDQTRARRFVGKQVRVTGKLEMKSNTIRVDMIDPLR